MFQRHNNNFPSLDKQILFEMDNEEHMEWQNPCHDLIKILSEWDNRIIWIMNFANNLFVIFKITHKISSRTFYV